MKTLFLLLFLVPPATLLGSPTQVPQLTLPSAPQLSSTKIPLFESVDVVKKYMEGKTKYDYSKLELKGIQKQYYKSHPRKGVAWAYFFSTPQPSLGGENSILHFMDGEIVEFHHGP